MTPTLLNIIRVLGDSVDVTSVAAAVTLHVIGVDDAYECQRKIKTLIDESKPKPLIEEGTKRKKKAEDDPMAISAQKFRLLLADVAYVHLNLKFFVFNILKNGNTVSNCKHYMEMFGITRNDVILLRRVFDIRGFKASCRVRLSQIKRSDIDQRAFRSVFTTFDNIHVDILKHIKRKVYTKLRFISTSSNIEFYDLHMELMCKALQTYIKMVPIQRSELHVANSIRLTLNNHTTNMIKANTTQKRARLVKSVADGFGGNKFDIITVSENQLFRAFGLEENVVYDSLQNSELNNDEEKHRESMLTYARLLKRFGVTSKRRSLIELTSVQENDKFTEFLRKEGHITTEEDNVDFNEAVGDQKYFKYVCSFLSVCEKRAKRFIKTIGRKAYPELAKNLEFKNAK